MVFSAFAQIVNKYCEENIVGSEESAKLRRGRAVRSDFMRAASASVRDRLSARQATRCRR